MFNKKLRAAALSLSISLVFSGYSPIMAEEVLPFEEEGSYLEDAEMEPAEDVYLEDSSELTTEWQEDLEQNPSDAFVEVPPDWQDIGDGELESIPAASAEGNEDVYEEESITVPVFDESIDADTETPDNDEGFGYTGDLDEDYYTEQESPAPQDFEEDGDDFLISASGDPSDGGYYSANGRLLMASAAEYSGCYGNQLDSESRRIYDGMVSAWGNGGTNLFYITLGTPLPYEVMKDEEGEWVGKNNDTNFLAQVTYVRRYIQAAFDAFVYDYPEAYWVARVGFSMDTPVMESNLIDGEIPDFCAIKTIRVSGVERWSGAKSSTASFLSAVQEAYTEASSGFSPEMVTAERIKVLHDYVIGKGYYSEGTYSHTAYGFFCGGGAVVCEGYTKALKILCRLAGLESALISGDANTSLSYEPHMWLNVLIDGSWYLVDPTWNDQLTGIEYLFVGSNSVVRDHKISDERSVYTSFSTGDYSSKFATPVISSDAYHLWKEVQKTEASCTENGKADYQCSICGTTKTETLYAKGHIWGKAYVEKASTCAENGVEARKCTKCDVVQEKSLPLSEKHGETDWVITSPASCSKEGEKSQKCRLCGKILKTEKISKIAHSYSGWKTVQEPTVLKSGKKERTCSSCGAVETAAIDKLKASVSLNVSSLTLEEGKSFTLSYSGLKKGDSIKSWVSSNPSAASVSSGAVTAKSAGTAVITVTTNGGASAECSITVTSKILPAPTGVIAYNSVQGGDIRWNSVAGAEGYAIYRNRGPEGTKRIAIVSGRNNTKYMDAGIKDNCWGRVYNYYVRALYKGKEMKQSRPATLQRLAPVTISLAKGAKSGTVDVFQTCVVKENKAYGYQIQYARSISELQSRKGSSYREVLINGRNILEKTVGSLQSGKTYYFRTRCYVDYTNSSTGKKYRTWSQYSNVSKIVAK